MRYAEKINVTELLEKHQLGEDSIGGWLSSAICKLVNNTIIENGQSKSIAPDNLLFFDIEVTINGFPVKFSSLIESLYNSYHEELNERANEKIKSLLENKQTQLYEAIDQYEQNVIDILKQYKFDVKNKYE